MPFFYIKCVVLRMYLPESPFFKNSLAGASRLVLMSNPGVSCIPQLKESNWYLVLWRIANFCSHIAIFDMIESYSPCFFGPHGILESDLIKCYSCSNMVA